MPSIEGKVLDQKLVNEVVLQRVYRRDMLHLLAIKRKLMAMWGRNASFADAISFLIQFHLDVSAED